ncbi:transcriptional repressor [Lapidilactobacillus concavus]|nr:transcriptional repressor [Lapidilactobacillus concavus]
MVDGRYAHARELLQQHHIRMTPQRNAILKILVHSHAHPTAEAVYNQLKTQVEDISIATVYNNLRLFTELGVIQELKYGNEPSHFDYVSVRHFHVVCQQCGQVVDVFYPDLEKIERLVTNLTGYETVGNNIEVYGICPDCQRRQAHLDAT